MIGNENIEEVSKILLTGNLHINTQNIPSSPILQDQDEIVSSNQREKTNQKWRPVTLYTYATKIELFRLLIYMGIFFLMVNNIRTRQQIQFIVLAIIVTGVSVAFIGLLQYLSGTEKIFWRYDIKRTSFFGTFSNRDHFACYMSMITPLVFGLIITEYLHYRKNNSQFYPQSESAGHKTFFCTFAIVIMLSSLFLARSGGGAFAMITSLFLLIGIMACRKRLRKMVWYVIPVLLVTFSLLVWIGIHPVIEKLSTTIDIENPSLQARVEFWKDTISAIKNFPLFGCGIGVFPFIYPQYSTVTYVHGVLINHAHNDYLELMLETGIIGFAIILWALFRFIKDSALYHMLGITKGIDHERPDRGLIPYLKIFRTQRIPKDKESRHQKHEDHLKKRNDPFIMGIAIGGIIGVISISLHSIVDFNTHIPANAFLLSILLGITTVAVHMKHEEHMATEGTENTERKE